MMRLAFSAAVAISATVLFPFNLSSQEHHHGAEGGDPASLEKLGTVTMPISCATSAQVPFERGIALLHSFWYEEAAKQFATVAESEPACAMARWGLAMTEWRPLWDGIDKDRRAAATVDIDKATALKPKTDRERQYIAALSGFLHSDPKKSEQATAAYTAAMGKLHTDYPEDTEAAAFYGLALIANVGVADPVGDSRKALAVLEPEFRAHPNHPGFAHYIVHTCDSPQLAREGLPAAERYASIAPSSPHALHMPGHIFARLGMWPPDITSNEASAAASESAEKNHQGGVAHQMHAKEFLLYAYLQDGDDANARRILDNTHPMIAHLNSLPDFAADGMAAMVPLVQIEYPGIYYLETRDWTKALTLQAPSGPDSPIRTFVLSYAEWVHAIAAGHLHNAAAAQEASTHADQLFAQARARGVSSMTEVELQIFEGTIHAWQNFAAGNNDDALKQISSAADQQDRFGQGEVDIPVREMYADMLLELNRPAEALAQYRTSQQLSPNRFNGVYNAGRAAEAAGAADEAKNFYAQLMRITDDGSRTGRPEMAHARDYLKIPAQ